jgi:hypothetical protein
MTFKKLDDLPKIPHSYDDVMKAMGELHKLVLKQAEAYGGKKSKYIPAHVLETSLLKAVDVMIEDSDCDEAGRLMDLAQQKAQALADHLKDSGDKKAMSLLGQMLKYTGIALGHAGK